MKTIVAGGRDFEDYEMMSKVLSSLQDEYPITEIVCGMARGADSLGLRYANENGIAVGKFPADWKRYGRRAGFVRNREMAEHADVLIAFWDGESRGTKHMINIANKLKLKVFVIKYNQNTGDLYDNFI